MTGIQQIVLAESEFNTNDMDDKGYVRDKKVTHLDFI